MKLKLVFLSLVFTSALAFSQSQTCNCCTENHDDFDFWIGEWSVKNSNNGTPAGTSKIEKIEGECVVKENWTSASAGYTGTSFNFYNQKTKQWEQLWLDNQGASLHLKGNRIENQMILKSDKEKNAQGQLFYHQITWTKNEDGTVQQKWETFTEGQDVVVAFDGLYSKKES